MLADRIRMGGYKKQKQSIDRTTPATVINQPYSTKGNGGRKLVRLDNGWLVTGIRGTHIAYFMISKDAGVTWSQLCYATGLNTTFEASGGVSLVSKGTTVYALLSTTISTYLVLFDALTVRNENLNSIWIFMESQTSLNSSSLAINEQGTELHACWSSKNSTYPNSFNIRYCKGTINIDGSVTWGGVEQVTKQNSTSVSMTQPTIVIANQAPIIIYMFQQSTLQSAIIASHRVDSARWSQLSVVYYGDEYLQSSPSACVDRDGVIHVTWQGLDSSDTQNDIRYSKSLDNGLTWSSMEIASNGWPYQRINPSIAVNRSGDIFIVAKDDYAGGRVMYIKKSKSYDVWEPLVAIANSNKHSPSVCENYTDFELPLLVYQDVANGIVNFWGKWYE